MSRCLVRLEENWVALEAFFLEVKEAMEKKPSSFSSYATTKISSIYNFLMEPVNKLYLYFLIFATDLFNPFLTKFQSADPLIQILWSDLEELIKGLYRKFLTVEPRRDKKVTEVEYEEESHQKAPRDLGVGSKASDYASQRQENNLRSSKIDSFRENVKKFYHIIVKDLLKNLPLQDELLQNIKVANLEKQSEAKFSQLDFFLKRFPCILPEGFSRDSLRHQFEVYEELDISDVVGLKVVGKGGNETKLGEDKKWRLIGEQNKIAELSQVMRNLLTIPHGSAHCERVFSQVRKNKTFQRNSLGVDKRGLSKNVGRQIS